MNKNKRLFFLIFILLSASSSLSFPIIKIDPSLEYSKYGGGKKKLLKCLKLSVSLCVTFSIYFLFGLIVAVDSLQTREFFPILILPLPIENKKEERQTNKGKTSISTIRSRQRKTTDCLLATAP